MSNTFQQMISGPAFKVVNETTGLVEDAFHTHAEAQQYADTSHHLSVDHTHFQVIEIKWCGGSKRLSDLKTG